MMKISGTFLGTFLRSPQNQARKLNRRRSAEIVRLNFKSQKDAPGRSAKTARGFCPQSLTTGKKDMAHINHRRSKRHRIPRALQGNSPSLFEWVDQQSP